MSDFFSSALSYFSGGSDSSSGGSRFVGQTVDLGEGNKLKVKKVIAEGEFKGKVREGIFRHAASVALFLMYRKAKIFEVGTLGCCCIDSVYTDFQADGF